MHNFHEGVSAGTIRYVRILQKSSLRFQERVKQLRKEVNTFRMIPMSQIRQLMKDFFIPLSDSNESFMDHNILSGRNASFTCGYATKSDPEQNTVRVAGPAIVMVIHEMMTQVEWKRAWKAVFSASHTPLGRVWPPRETFKDRVKDMRAVRKCKNMDLLLDIYRAFKEGKSFTRIRDDLSEIRIKSASGKSKAGTVYGTEDVRRMYKKIKKMIEACEI